MKNFFITSKRNIAAILTLCILLGIVGTCACATAMAEKTTVVVEETTVVAEEITIATEENTVVTEETTPELMPVMARGCEYNLPDDFLNGGQWTDNYSYIESRLIKYHGGTAESISYNLHSIKSYYGLPANYNCIFDMTGGVYNQYGDYLGNLLNW